MNEPVTSDLLIFEREYHCWIAGEYVGTAIYTDTKEIGPAFLNAVVDGQGRLIYDVIIPDKCQMK